MEDLMAQGNAFRRIRIVQFNTFFLELITDFSYIFFFRFEGPRGPRFEQPHQQRFSAPPRFDAGQRFNRPPRGNPPHLGPPARPEYPPRHNAPTRFERPPVPSQQPGYGAQSSHVPGVQIKQPSAKPDAPPVAPSQMGPEKNKSGQIKISKKMGLHWSVTDRWHIGLSGWIFYSEWTHSSN